MELAGPIRAAVSVFTQPGFLYTVGALALVAALTIAWRRRVERPGRASRLAHLADNWQLLLLSSTAFILSCASGWTTWDGMRNFTGEPILSAMVTFGIQGVMLIVAWLIGESFATGMSQRIDRDTGRPMSDATLKAALGLILGGIAIGALSLAFFYFRTGVSGSKVATASAALAFVLAALGALIIAARAPTMRSYFDATRVIVRTGVLWVMFLACMATSVFFSFDSLFTAIFPQSERVRAAELRAQNQVAGIVADIGTMISERQVAEAERLFDTEGWRAYEGQLVSLARNAQSAQGEIERYFVEQMEGRRRAIAEQTERIAGSERGQTGLLRKRDEIEVEKTRLEQQLPSLQSALDKAQADLADVQGKIAAKKIEANAESGGVEGTGKVGRGPMYRQRMDELDLLQRTLATATEPRFKDAQKARDQASARLVSINRELATINGEVAKYKGEQQTAESRIKAAQETLTQDDGPKLDPARILPAFERARAEFRQAPRVEKLAELQRMCAGMLTAMSSTPTTKERVRGVDCDPKQASEAAARVFALNAGFVAFEKNCAGGERLAEQKTADALFGFARRCAQDSGLAGRDTDELRTKINSVELNRDDKAHRFVVTWNAFLDGNRLAYLALAIAIAIDSLVFMSGLFGANAVRSPLSDVPTSKARSARQLEATINAALGARPFENASSVLDAMKPMTNVDGYSSFIDLGEFDRGRADVVRRVLNAGADLGAVEHVGPGDTYRIRGELREYLSTVCDRHMKADDSFVQRAKLETIVRVSLSPHTREHADIVLHHMHPYAGQAKFTSEVDAAGITDAYEARVVRKALNAAATQGAVSAEGKTRDRYLITPAFYETLAHIYAGDPPSQTYLSDRQLFIDHRGVIPGGALGTHAAALPRGAQSDPRQQISYSAPVHPPAAPPRQAANDPGLSYVVREHYARELSLDTDYLDRIIAAAAVADAAQLNRALDGALKRDAELRRRMTEAAKSFSDLIDIALDTFPDQLLRDPANMRDANDLAQLLKRHAGLRLLMPLGAYETLLGMMQDEMAADDAGGRLDRFKQRKLQIVARHLAEIRIADRTTRGGWDRVAASLQRFDSDLAELAGADQRPSQLN
jgi:hypothetical protein